MKYYYQNDPLWRNDIMTRPPYPNGSKQKKPDTLGSVGCYVTSLANCYNIINSADITPKDVNNMLVKSRGYRILLLGKDCPINQESFLVEIIFEKLYNLKVSDPLKLDKFNKSGQFICRWNWSGTVGHYSNVIDIMTDCVIVFNVFNGKQEIIQRNKIDFIREVSK